MEYIHFEKVIIAQVVKEVPACYSLPSLQEYTIVNQIKSVHVFINTL
jgi:hypothetical protein